MLHIVQSGTTKTPLIPWESLPRVLSSGQADLTDELFNNHPFNC